MRGTRMVEGPAGSDRRQEHTRRVQSDRSGRTGEVLLDDPTIISDHKPASAKPFYPRPLAGRPRSQRGWGGWVSAVRSVGVLLAQLGQLLLLSRLHRDTQ